MTTLQDYTTQVQFLLHDQANADFSQTELTNAINNARNVVALDFQCVRVTYLTPPNAVANPGAYNPVGVIPNQEIYYLQNEYSGATGSAASNPGIVVGACVTAGGSGYSSNTTVSFSAGPTGSIRATGTPVIASGVITAISMTAWGYGYLAAVLGTATFANLPTVTITDTGGGTGATARAVMFNNVFNVNNISYIWGNQRYMLKFRAFWMFQAYMRSQLFFTQRGIVTTVQEEQGFVMIQPPPDQGYQTEWDTICLPQPLSSLTDADTQILPPANDAVQYYAASYCMNKLQNFNQAEYLLKLYAARVPKIIIGKYGLRIPNPYSKTFQRRAAR